MVKVSPIGYLDLQSGSPIEHSLMIGGTGAADTTIWIDILFVDQREGASSIIEQLKRAEVLYGSVKYHVVYALEEIYYRAWCSFELATRSMADKKSIFISAEASEDLSGYGNASRDSILNIVRLPTLSEQHSKLEATVASDLTTIRGVIKDKVGLSKFQNVINSSLQGTGLLHFKDTRLMWVSAAPLVIDVLKHPRLHQLVYSLHKSSHMGRVEREHNPKFKKLAQELNIPWSQKEDCFAYRDSLFKEWAELQKKHPGLPAVRDQQDPYNVVIRKEGWSPR